MLRAYDYYDINEEDRVRKNFKKNAFFAQEVELAHSFCETQAETRNVSCCFFCGKQKLRKVYSKWGIDYFECQSCYSVLSSIADKSAFEYRNLDAKIQLWNQTEFQNYANEVRMNRWEDFIAWMKYRIYRYVGSNEDLDMLDCGNRWLGLRDMLYKSTLTKNYIVYDSLLNKNNTEVRQKDFDVVIAMDYFQQKTRWDNSFDKINDVIKKNGLLVIGNRMGSGLDVLMLNENNDSIFPPEHNALPSMEGIKRYLESMGYRLLEFTSQGTFDVNHVVEKISSVEHEIFLKRFLTDASPIIKAEFQRLIQKAGYTSYAQIIARKE